MRSRCGQETASPLADAPKGLERVEVEWDLKAPYDVSRILVKRGKGGQAGCPLAFRCAFAPDEKGFCLAEPDERRRARFVRLSFELDPGRRTSLDDIWIFGYLPQ